MYIWKFCIIFSCSLGLSRPFKQTGRLVGAGIILSLGRIQIGNESLDPVNHFMYPFTNRSHFPHWNCRYMTPDRKVMELYNPAPDVIQQREFPFVTDEEEKINNNLLSLQYQSRSICKEAFVTRSRKHKRTFLFARPVVAACRATASKPR